MQAHKQGKDINKEKDGVRKRKSEHLGARARPMEVPPTHSHTHPSSA